MNRFIAASAAGYAGIGIASFLRPALVPRLFGGTADTVDSRTEIRAVYGGLPLAIAATLAVAPSSAVPMAAVSAGMAIGRAASVAVEEEKPTFITPAFVAIESALAVALLLGARRHSKR